MLSPRWHWIALLACAGTAQGVGAQALPPDPVPADAAELPSADTTERRRWVLPPLRLSGNLAYDFRGSRGDGEGQAVGHLVTANASLQTFIYQPWLATLDAELGMTQGWSRQSSGSGFAFDGGAVNASLHETIRTREQFLTGRARVGVFPESRFPFEMHVERTDSRLNSGLASTFDFQTSNIGFSQRYRPPGGEYTLSGSYDHREQRGAGFRGLQDTLNADFERRFKHHELGVGFTHSRTHTDGADDESRFTSLVARHGFNPSTALSVDTTANLTRSEDRGLFAGSDLKLMQLSSVGTYRRENSPLYLTGSALGLVLRDDTGARLNSGSLSLGSSYTVNEHLRVTASGGVSGAQSNGENSGGVTGSLGASYQGPSVELGGFRYDWFASASGGTGLSDSTSGPVQRQSSLATSVGHSLGRNWPLGASAGLSLNASQSLAWGRSFSTTGGRRDPGEDSSVSLVNSIAATLQGGDGSRTAYARASYNDAMELTGPRSHFQLFNVQVSGNWEIDSQRSMTGDLTFQRTWERTPDLQLPGDPFATQGRRGTMGASGEVSYRHTRLFGQPRLVFSSRLRLAQDVLKQPGFLSSLPDHETVFWENRLDWGIGRLETQVALRMSMVDGRRRESIMFRIQRSFGD